MGPENYDFIADTSGSNYGSKYGLLAVTEREKIDYLESVAIQRNADFEAENGDKLVDR